MEYSLFLIAIALGTILHFSIQKIFIINNKFDNLNQRSSHKTTATRTGGIGIFLTLLITSFYFYFQKIELFDYSLLIPLSIMFLIGVYDDLYNADFKIKFFLQIIVAKILIDLGFVITNFHGLFGLYNVNWLLAQATTVFVFIVVVNSINFIDGIDGLAITEVLKILFFIEVFSQNNTPLYLTSTLLIGSMLPLYYFNFKKMNKVFLGDGGSMLLGTVVIMYILHVLGEDYVFEQNIYLNKTFFVIILVLYPLVDLLRVFILRTLRGQSPFKADQNHIHHILLKKTNSMFLVNIILFSLSIILLISFYHELIF